MDKDADGERLRQRMDDLLRDARALRALIDEASQIDSSKGERKPPEPTTPPPHSRAHHTR